jgi:hypothetical protein
MYAIHSSVAVTVPAEIAPRIFPMLSKLDCCDVASSVVLLLGMSVCKVYGTVNAALWMGQRKALLQTLRPVCQENVG